MMKLEYEPVPAWLDEFIENVAIAYEIWNPTDRAVGWQWSQDEGAFEVLVYPTLVEVEGKPCLASDIRIEISQILELFERCTNISMGLNCYNDDDYLSIEGSVDGHDVWLRLLLWPPDGDDAPAARLHADGSFEEIASCTAANSNEAP